jgi:hypothetical protein
MTALAELARLVEDAEQDGCLRRSLRRCRSRAELVLAARRLGYAIHKSDLRRLWLLERLSGEHGETSGSPPCPPENQPPPTPGLACPGNAATP